MFFRRFDADGNRFGNCFKRLIFMRDELVWIDTLLWGGGNRHNLVNSVLVDQGCIIPLENHVEKRQDFLFRHRDGALSSDGSLYGRIDYQRGQVEEFRDLLNKRIQIRIFKNNLKLPVRLLQAGLWRNGHFFGFRCSRLWWTRQRDRSIRFSHDSSRESSHDSSCDSSRYGSSRRRGWSRRFYRDSFRDSSHDSPCDSSSYGLSWGRRRGRGRRRRE